MQSISEETKQKLIKAGYKVETAGKLFWAVNPEGFSIVSGPIYNENGAWEVCERDYNWKLEK